MQETVVRDAGAGATLAVSCGLASDGGQGTVEYVLVMLAAAALAVALISWIGGTSLIPEFFDSVFRTITGYVA